jgi:hypothetical protein
MSEKLFGITLPPLSGSEETPYTRTLLRYEQSKAEYERSLTMGWPVVLIMIGLFGLFVFSIVGLLLIIAGLAWAVIRFASRGHLYQKMRDAEKDLKELEKV